MVQRRHRLIVDGMTLEAHTPNLFDLIWPTFKIE